METTDSENLKSKLGELIEYINGRIATFREFMDDPDDVRLIWYCNAMEEVKIKITAALGDKGEE